MTAETHSTSVSFTLNGRHTTVSAAPNRMLADVLRDDHRLTGLKIGCDQAVCGACTVLVDDRPVASCATFVFMLDGTRVETIETAEPDAALKAVQAAFKANSAFQCGYCTPGFILLATALLRRNPAPDRPAIRDWLSANICRCTGYQMIVEAVEDAARRLGEAE